MISLLRPATCANCMHYKLNEPASQQAASANLKAPKVGFCHRFPPAVMLVTTPAGAQIVQANPTVQEDHCCGEFRLTVLMT